MAYSAQISLKSQQSVSRLIKSQQEAFLLRNELLPVKTYSSTQLAGSQSITDSKIYKDLVYRIQSDGGIQLALARSSSKTSYASYYVPVNSVCSTESQMGGSSSKVGASVSNSGKKKKKRFRQFRGRVTEFRDMEQMKHNYMTKGRMNESDYDDDDDAIGTEIEIGERYRREVSFDLLRLARYIINQVVKLYGSGDKYLEQTYGRRISYVEATERLLKYLYDHNMDGAVTVIWSKKLACSALMVAKGHAKKPENRKYILYVKDSDDNPYLREQGIYCLMNHEIFTHYLRFFNDALQVWCGNRKRFDLKPLSSIEFADTEEGLAVLNSMLASNERYLFLPALSYYTVCKATEMSFDELFNHLGEFITSPEVRWKYAMRATSVPSRAPVQHSITRQKIYPANAKDQCYFTGAVEILRKLDTIDFKTLISGKIALSDLPRISRIARLNVIRVPDFLKSEDLYKTRLIEIAVQNEVVVKPEAFAAIKKAAKKHAILNQVNNASSVAKNRTNGNSIPRSQSIGSRQKSFHHSIEPMSEDDPEFINPLDTARSENGPAERIVKTWKPRSVPSATLIPRESRGSVDRSNLEPMDFSQMSARAKKVHNAKKFRESSLTNKRLKSKVVFSNTSPADSSGSSVLNGDVM